MPDDSIRSSRFGPPDDITAGRHGGNPESEAAYEVAKCRKETLHLQIMRHVESVGAATAQQISRDLGIPIQTATARCSELRKDGRLVPTGERAKTPTGCWAALLKPSYVWPDRWPYTDGGGK